MIINKFHYKILRNRCPNKCEGQKNNKWGEQTYFGRYIAAFTLKINTLSVRIGINIA